MEFDTMYCKGNVRQLDYYDVILKGTIKDDVKDGKVYYIAAAGPDRRATFTGSGLPFANQIQAFDNTPNVGQVDLDMSNSFTIKLVTPNSYMVGLGSVTIPPTVFLKYLRPNGEERKISIKVAEPIAYRSLTYPLDPRPRKDSTFYDTQFELIPKTQEQLFYDSAYPCDGVTHPNFWGARHVN